jgi:hypothetical protein
VGATHGKKKTGNGANPILYDEVSVIILKACCVEEYVYCGKLWVIIPIHKSVFEASSYKVYYFCRLIICAVALQATFFAVASVV